jgi:transcriptional regulator with XRE-family HTH domain
MRDLRKAVTERITALGPKEASKFFGVSLGTISNWTTGKTSPSIDAVELIDGDDYLDEEDNWRENLNEPRKLVDPDALYHWMGKDVIILLPVYRTFNPDTHFTLFANYAKYGPEKVGMIQEKRTCVYEARNICVHKALKTDANKFIFVDDDMILPCGVPDLFNGRYRAGVSARSASFNTISRLMSHSDEKEIVGALYFGRHELGKAQCCRGFESPVENEKLRKGKYNDLITDEWVGTGCMRVTRSALQKMADAIDGGKWPDISPKSLAGWRGYFTPTAVGVGEDVSFCRRAKEIGIQTWVDASLVCLHVGDVPFGPLNTKG